MWRESDVQRRRSRRWNRTTITTIRTLTWWCRRRFRSSTTTLIHRETRAKEESPVALIIIGSNIEKAFNNSSKKIVKWIPMDRIMQQRVHRPLNFPSAISARFAASHRATPALHAGRGSVVLNASQHIKIPAAWSLLTKLRTRLKSSSSQREDSVKMTAGRKLKKLIIS